MGRRLVYKTLIKRFLYLNPVNSMKKSTRRLLNLFAMVLLAFAIYLNVFHKDEQDLLPRQPAAKASVQLSVTTH
jgi:hypothetical protein